ncbi:uncharacterized, partial [Tachysurus ichikawai]
SDRNICSVHEKKLPGARPKTCIESDAGRVGETDRDWACGSVWSVTAGEIALCTAVSSNDDQERRMVLAASLTGENKS